MFGKNRSGRREGERKWGGGGEREVEGERESEGERGRGGREREGTEGEN